MSNVGYSDGALDGILEIDGVLDGTSDVLGLLEGPGVGLSEGALLDDGARLIVGALVNLADR